MKEQIKEQINSYSVEVVDMFEHLRQLLFDSAPCEPEEKL